jgi:hypothetical protein
MPFFAVSPLLKVAVGVFGAGVAIRWVAKEVRRINAELERVKGATSDPAARQALPTLRRDPHTGDWRVM